jgi:phage N-6-adenine-methyltransferase
LGGCGWERDEAGGVFAGMITDVIADRLLECERVIERGLNTFVEVGQALLEIRDSGLYKDGYSTFEGYCRERWGMQRAHAYRLMDSAEVVKNLSPIGDILPINIEQTRPLAGLSPELQRDIWQEAIETAPNGKVTGVHVQEVVERIAKPHVSHNTGENEWYTPEQYIDAARRVMGSIDTDPASSDLANQTVKAGTYYTENENGLDKEWSGNIWMNPPYSQPLISEFIAAFAEKYNADEFNQACVLVNNATETGWYQSLLVFATAVCFLKGRVKFIDKNGNASGAPLQGQTVLYFGSDEKKFTDVFSEFGIILYGRGC